MDELVKRLSTSGQPVKVSLRPEENLQLLRDALDRGYVHIKFTETRGGTELGVRLDERDTDLSGGDLVEGSGRIHLEGDLTLNYIPVRCVADIDLSTFCGTGHLKPVEE